MWSVMVYAHGYLPFMKHKNTKKKEQILTILQAVVMTPDRYAGYSFRVATRLQEQDGVRKVPLIRYSDSIGVISTKKELPY